MKTSEAINIGSKILKNRNIISHKIDAEIILSHVLKTSREKLLINEQAISYKDLKRFKKIISRRLKKEPIAYIFNKKEFRSKDFFVDKKSYVFLAGTVLDYSGGLNGKGFVFNNPNAKTSCGCGTSFSV